MQHGPVLPQPAKPKGLPTWAIVLIVIGVAVPVVLGTLGVLAIYGVKRYLLAAKSAEAKNTIGAIARGAAAAYEREILDEEENVKHALCGSARPVPAAIPSGTKYQPSTAAGDDFDTGSATEGWKCLKFSMTQPMYYQYQYNRGTGYVARAVAPGPDGFEAAAQGDLNGDGVSSMFARTGSVSPSGQLVIATQIYIENELE